MTEVSITKRAQRCLEHVKNEIEDFKAVELTHDNCLEIGIKLDYAEFLTGELEDLIKTDAKEAVEDSITLRFCEFAGSRPTKELFMEMDYAFYTTEVEEMFDAMYWCLKKADSLEK